MPGRIFPELIINYIDLQLLNETVQGNDVTAYFRFDPTFTSDPKALVAYLGLREQVEFEFVDANSKPLPYSTTVNATLNLEVFGDNVYPLSPDATPLLSFRIRREMRGGYDANDNLTVDYSRVTYSLLSFDGQLTNEDGQEGEIDSLNSIVVPIEFRGEANAGEIGRAVPLRLPLQNFVYRLKFRNDDLIHYETIAVLEKLFLSLTRATDATKIHVDTTGRVATVAVLNYSADSATGELQIKSHPASPTFKFNRNTAFSSPQIICAHDGSTLVACKNWATGEFGVWRARTAIGSDADLGDFTVIFSDPSYREFSLIQLQSGQLACASIGLFNGKSRVSFKRQDEEGNWPADDKAVVIGDFSVYINGNVSLIELPAAHLMVIFRPSLPQKYQSLNGGTKWEKVTETS